ncbi:MAG TPA: hypothetical protein VIW24_11635 [Aldersonia sp.]
MIALSPPAGITATAWWRRAAAGLAVGSAVLHAVSLDHAHSAASVAVLAAMIVGCLYCARHLWSRGALGDWALVAAMNLGMIGLHASMLGSGGGHAEHTGHGGHTMAAASPIIAMSPLMSVALAVAVVEVAIALAVVLFRTKTPAHHP